MDEPRNAGDDPLPWRFNPPNMPPVVGRSWISGVSRVLLPRVGALLFWRELPLHDFVGSPCAEGNVDWGNPWGDESRRKPPFIHEGEDADGMGVVDWDARWNNCVHSWVPSQDEDPLLLT